jgi:hypothetical protein
MLAFQPPQFEQKIIQVRIQLQNASRFIPSASQNPKNRNSFVDVMAVLNRAILCSKRKPKSFRKIEDGSASIESVLWIPGFMFILMLATDAITLSTSQSNYWSISRDTAGLVACHAISPQDAELYAEANAVNKAAAPDATVSINGQTVTVIPSSPAAALTAFNVFSFASPFRIEAATTQALKPI